MEVNLYLAQITEWWNIQFISKYIFNSI
jgi:hypothetical protein